MSTVHRKISAALIVSLAYSACDAVVYVIRRIAEPVVSIFLDAVAFIVATIKPFLFSAPSWRFLGSLSWARTEFAYATAAKVRDGHYRHRVLAAARPGHLKELIVA